jgi:uncharacterized membrane protein
MPFPVFSGTADTARTLLQVIASSVATLVSLIFTILVVAVQLASSQYSPRALKTMLQDRPSHFTIGIFVGTFTYTLIILLGLRLTEDGAELISGFSTTIAFVLAVLSLGTFAVYSNHIIQSVRITSIINRVARDAREELERLYPNRISDHRHGDSDGATDFPSGRKPTRTFAAPKPGVITDIRRDKLLEIAARTDCTLVIVPVLGTYAPEEYPLVEE